MVASQYIRELMKKISNITTNIKKPFDLQRELNKLNNIKDDTLYIKKSFNILTIYLKSLNDSYDTWEYCFQPRNNTRKLRIGIPPYIPNNNNNRNNTRKLRIGIPPYIPNNNNTNNTRKLRIGIPSYIPNNNNNSNNNSNNRKNLHIGIPPDPEYSIKIVSFFRALQFSPEYIGVELKDFFNDDYYRVINNTEFKKFQKNFAVWSNVFNSNYTDIEEILKILENQSQIANNSEFNYTQSKLSNFILNKYMNTVKGTVIANPKKQFIKLFYDLILAYTSIYKSYICKSVNLDNCISLIYNSYFKGYFQGNVLKLLQNNIQSTNSDIHSSIIKSIIAYNNNSNTLK